MSIAVAEYDGWSAPVSTHGSISQERLAPPEQRPAARWKARAAGDRSIKRTVYPRSGVQMNTRGYVYPRLNLGSGPVSVPGWINIDCSPNVVLDRLPLVKDVLHKVGILQPGHLAPWSRDIVRRDLRKPLPFEDGMVDAIYSSHTLEHMYSEDARALLSETRRVLRADGVLRLALPDAAIWAREFLDGLTAGRSDAGQKLNERLLAHPARAPRGVRAVLFRVNGHTHLWQPSVPLLEEMLAGAGFSKVKVCNFRSGALPGLAEIETREESFFLEAQR